ncbi:MAG: methionyl-tRNA formyltransferase [Planctomycetota bacterium]|nr:methionyl-tRNA formyltransferase [Planctomycetota bacterium]
MNRARIAFLGSGSFGIPTLNRLAEEHDLVAIVSQPDRPAGRGRESTATLVSEWALERGYPLHRVEDLNAEPARAALDATQPDALVIIAFGQRIGPEVLANQFALNLHGSLLPRWRGAAPIQRSVMENDAQVGVSVISIAPRMDAGVVYARASTVLEPTETAGELHDRLALLGVNLVAETIAAWQSSTLNPQPQDESLVCRARKLSRADAWVDWTAHSNGVAARINGLSPWPGADLELAGRPLKVLRARSRADVAHPVGVCDASGMVGCGTGSIELLDVQPPGSRSMSWNDFARGFPGGAQCAAGAIRSVHPVVGSQGVST